jgi:SPP1 gp7 family putative phage head morphogenesis protein
MNRNHRKQNKRKMRAVSSPKSPEIKYRRQLDFLVRKLKQQINSNLIPALKAFESEYVTDAYAKSLEEVFDRMRRSFDNVAKQAAIVSNSFVNESNQVNKRRFYKAMEEAVGVDLQSIVRSENLEDILVATTIENVSLIKSIPDEYFKNIESIVFTNTTQGRTASSMIKQIQKQGKVTTRRAKLIARDQSSKLNSALNQQRQKNLGVEEYIWRTAGDSRVREDHNSKNGKIFRWDSPPADTGHPGQDIQCRCVAQPIINI